MNLLRSCFRFPLSPRDLRRQVVWRTCRPRKYLRWLPCLGYSWKCTSGTSFRKILPARRVGKHKLWCSFESLKVWLLGTPKQHLRSCKGLSGRIRSSNSSACKCGTWSSPSRPLNLYLQGRTNGQTCFLFLCRLIRTHWNICSLFQECCCTQGALSRANSGRSLHSRNQRTQVCSLWSLLPSYNSEHLHIA